MELKKNDFIEIEFTGRVKDTGEVFDSNIKSELEKLHKGHNHPIESKPFIYCLGAGMFMQSVDDFLIGKKLGEYIINLNAEKAFGSRDQKAVQMIPLKIFLHHGRKPEKGEFFNFDGRVGKIASVSGGRVLVDFNHPLSGKDLIYEINVKRRVEDINEKIKAFNEFIFKKEIKYEISDKKVIYHVEENLMPLANIFKDKFKEIFGMELECVPEKINK